MDIIAAFKKKPPSFFGEAINPPLLIQFIAVKGNWFYSEFNE